MMRGFGLKYHNASPRRPAVLSRNNISQKTARQSFWSRSSSGTFDFDFDFHCGGDAGKISGVGVDVVVSMIAGADAARSSVSVGV